MKEIKAAKRVSRSVLEASPTKKRAYEPMTRIRKRPAVKMRARKKGLLFKIESNLEKVLDVLCIIISRR